MPTLHQFDYLFAIGVIFCTLDAFMIGANDVANSFATSVSSKSLSMKQAILAAAIFEFLGAVTVGARTASTIKNGIVPASIFEGNPGLQLLTFTNAIFISSVWLTIATRLSWPVSTTYSIVAAVAGSGIGAAGFNAPNWGWNNGSGLGAIWAGLGIAPAMAAAFAAIVFTMVKYGVLKRKDSVRWGLYTGPFWFFLVAAVCTMSIIYKGSPTLHLDAMSPGKTAAAIILTGLVIAIIAILFWVPYVYAKVIKKDHTIRFYHFFFGPLLWRRPAPADAGEHSFVPDYRVRQELDGDVVLSKTHNGAATEGGDNLATVDGAESSVDHSAEEKVGIPGLGNASDVEEPIHASRLESEVEQPATPVGPLAWVYKNVILRVYKALTHGSTVDIHKLQQGEAHTVHGKRMQEIYAKTVQYPNETEHLFSFLQVMTACTASFAHGANDLSNAIGPFSVIYYTWKTGNLAGSKVPVEVWYLVYGAAALVLGLATYGYNIMAVLGNRITLHSPSRGFTMELGAAITVILASQYGIPVSTTMCITGATIGTSLISAEGFKGTNWRALGWIYLGWLSTIVVVMTASACSMGIIVNAPRKA